MISENTTPNITVIMPVYNSAVFLKDSIESMLSQTYKAFVFLIIDDGSIDQSADIIKAYAQKDSRIIYEKNHTNLGLVKTLNKGLDWVENRRCRTSIGFKTYFKGHGPNDHFVSGGSGVPEERFREG